MKLLNYVKINRLLVVGILVSILPLSAMAYQRRMTVMLPSYMTKPAQIDVVYNPEAIEHATPTCTQTECSFDVRPKVTGKGSPFTISVHPQGDYNDYCQFSFKIYAFSLGHWTVLNDDATKCEGNLTGGSVNSDHKYIFNMKMW